MTETPDSPAPRTLWHRLLATLLEELLSPVGIQVYTDFPLLSKSPEADILLLRRDSPQWTTAQRLRLPDGIRDSSASHILIEFKYTESVNEEALLQTLSYDTIYKRAKGLKATDVQTVLISAKTPQAATLTEWGYVAATNLPGVYRSHERSLRLITLLSLNDLSAEPHNAFVKTFASRRQQKREAFATMKRTGLSWLTAKLQWFLAGLQTYWFSTDTGEDFMKQQLTPEKVMALGEEWILACLATLPVEKRLEFMGLTAQERLAGLPASERLAGLPASELVAKLSVQERLAGLTPAEIENYLRQLPH